MEILENPVSKYSFLRIIPLVRDNRRKLGETRNVSVRASSGKYVLLHLDTDDIWDPYIVTFTKIYHDLEKRLNINILCSVVCKYRWLQKKLFIDNPYPNIYYVEDRILWNNLKIKNKLFYLES